MPSIYVGAVVPMLGCQMLYHLSHFSSPQRLFQIYNFNKGNCFKKLFKENSFSQPAKKFVFFFNLNFFKILQLQIVYEHFLLKTWKPELQITKDLHTCDKLISILGSYSEIYPRKSMLITQAASFP